MKVSYKISGGTAGYVTLFDDAAGAIIPEFTPQFSAVMQEEPLYGANAPFRAPRKNISVSWPLAGTVNYLSESVAFTNIRAMSLLLGQKLHFRVQPGTGPAVHYYPNAVIESYTPQPAGREVLHRFSVRSDPATHIEP